MSLNPLSCLIAALIFHSLSPNLNIPLRYPIPFSTINHRQLLLYISLSDPAPLQTNLDELIEGLQRKYSRMTSLVANFSQTYQGRNGRVMNETGLVMLKRPGKARWAYASPEKKLFISDGKNIFFYVQGETRASKTSIKTSTDPQIPFLFLLGRGNLRKDFSRIELLNDERAIEAGNKVLRLIPTQAPEEFKRLLVEVSPVTFQVKRLVIFERGGGRMDFVLSQVQENPPLSDSQFQFTPPDGVTIRKQ
jgi:outer membrane lipoprotein carrier protein